LITLPGGDAHRVDVPARVLVDPDTGLLAWTNNLTVLRIRIRIRRIRMFLGLLDPDPLVRGMDLDTGLLAWTID
jgi:hypothetical protein